MTARLVVLAAAIAAVALAVVPAAGATDECRGLNPCVSVSGPWVVVPGGSGIPREQTQYQLTCPTGYVVAGLDAELNDPAIDLAFLGTSGSPVSPGVSTSRTVVFVASNVGARPSAPVFRPHVGCIPTAGGGRRTPTGRAAVGPPGHPTVRRVVAARVSGTRRIVVACKAGERLVSWYASRGFATAAPPPPALVASLTTAARLSAGRIEVVARARRGQGPVQVGAVCAGGK